MISSVFGKTKPIIHVLVLVFLTLIFSLSRWRWQPRPISAAEVPGILLSLATLLFSVLLLHFIIQRNRLTATHGYSLFFFGMLCAGFPRVLVYSDGIYANFFFLLALRRFLSMQSLQRIAAKLFDGFLWLLVSSLFVKWTLFMLPLGLVFLYVYQPRVFRNWLVPLASLAVFLLVAYGVSILMGRPDALWSYYGSWTERPAAGGLWAGFSTRQLFYLLLVGTTVVISFVKLGKSGHGRLVGMRLLVLTLVVGLLAGSLWKPLQESALLFSFFPAVVFFSRYIETIRKKRFREVLLWSSLVLGLFGCLWEAVIK